MDSINICIVFFPSDFSFIFIFNVSVSPNTSHNYLQMVSPLLLLFLIMNFQPTTIIIQFFHQVKSIFSSFVCVCCSVSTPLVFSAFIVSLILACWSVKHCLTIHCFYAVFWCLIFSLFPKWLTGLSSQCFYFFTMLALCCN